MRYEANSPEEYIAQLPDSRRAAVAALRDAVRHGLPEGFEETMLYDMITYVVPHAIYPAGYHVNPKDPLPFLSIGSQKHYIALYHMGLYVFPEVRAWFQREYEKADIGKLDMGKSCIRFRREDRIPLELVTELCAKISLADYVRKTASA